MIHEMLHILGFSHEHQRPERDDFLTVDWTNLRLGQADNFWKDGYQADTSTLRFAISMNC